MIAVGDDAGLPEPVCHVHHLDLISDPVGTVEGVYRHFGMNCPAQAASGDRGICAGQAEGRLCAA